MSKFLHLLREFHPNNNSDPVLKVYEFLNSKGIQGMVDGDMLILDINGEKVRLSVISNEEEAEGMSQEVQDIAASTSPLKNQAQQIVKKKQTLAPKIVKKAGDQLKNLEKEVSRPTNIIR